ncbi:ATP-binding cassette domain-containing protein [Actinoplanes sp. NPDC051411]|uniref:ATP-binding cassette domain-containing protein n=1 Tax=Actinoplanes sp. NPDC051411 TaxID=3155522 RepID=UPI00342334EF
MNAVEVVALTKAYGKKVVLDGLDLIVPAGTVFALLGPNGAGKTTAVNIMSTLIRPDSGRAWVAGHDVAREPDAVRDAIALTGQFVAVDGLFTGEENLRLMADLRHLPPAAGRQRTAELIERFDLGEVARKPVMTWSGGMRRRLDLAMTLVGSPRVIFLDEPTTGLDPRSRRAVWEMIRDLVQGGVTLFLTTQYLEEADQLADRIALLDHGRVVASGTPEELKRLVPGGHVELRFASPADLDRAAALLPSASPEPSKLALRVPGEATPAELRDLLNRLGEVTASQVSLHSPDLDDVFLTLTGRPEEVVR